MAYSVKSENNCCCSRNGILIKILVVFLLCLLGLTFMMMMDSPGSLQHIIMTHLNITSYQFSLLYSMSSFPNAFTWIGGYLIDRYLGISLGSIILLTIACFGNALYIIGVYKKTFWIMLVARLLFGFGGEATSLACNTYILLWFPSKGTNIVFGLARCVPWLGSAIIFQISNRLYDFLLHNNMNDVDAFKHTSTITASVIIICLCSAIMLALISRPLLKQEKEIIEDMLYLKVTDITKFPFHFWFLIFASGLVMNSCLNFVLLSQNFFREYYYLDINSADNLISCFNITVFLAGPLLGYIVDQIGRNLIFITLSNLSALAAHLCFLYTSLHPIIPLVMLSCSLSLMISSVMSAYSFIVKSNELNTAYGVVQTVSSGFYAFGILIDGAIINKYSYIGAEIFYCICLGVALIICILLWVKDCRDGGTLNRSKKQKESIHNDQQSLIDNIVKEANSKMNYGGTLSLNESKGFSAEKRKTVFTISN